MNMPSLPHLITLLTEYKYILIFPITVLEGPIITVISGLLVSLGVLNGIVAYFLLALGDLTGDALYYWIGRSGRHSSWIKKWGKYLGYTEEGEKYLEGHFHKHPAKTFILGKLAHGVGGAVLVAAGIARVNFWEFIWYNIIGTLPKTLILLLIGYYAGSSYMQIDKYLSSIAIFTTVGVVLLVVLYIFVGRWAKNYFLKK